LTRFSNESSRSKFSNRSSFRKIETLRIHLEITQIAILLEEPRIILSANRIFHVAEQIAFSMFQSKSIFQANRSAPIFELGVMPKATSSPG
jgi:preprotein translocase subunit SecY